MAAIHQRILRPSLLPTTTSSSLPAFLIPAAQCTRNSPAARFSTSPIRCKKDNNTNRGVSAVRRTGLRPRQTLSVIHKNFKAQQLPKPVPIEEKLTGTPDHGLWDFFKDKQLLQTPLQESSHGRAWTIGELRRKDWEALHQLWWVCVKERNRLATEKIERQRLQAEYGDYETKERDKTIQETMKAILDTLAERQAAWKEAHKLAQLDPDVDLMRTDGPQFKEPTYDQFEPEDEESPSQVSQAQPLVDDLPQKDGSSRT